MAWLRAGHAGGTFWGHRTKLSIEQLIQLKNEKKLFYSEGGEILVAQRGCGVFIPGGIQNQTGRGPEQPPLLTVLGQGRWTGDTQRSFQSLRFCDSVKHRAHGSECNVFKRGCQERGTCWRVLLKGVKDMEGSWGNVGGCYWGVVRVPWGCK